MSILNMYAEDVCAKDVRTKDVGAKEECAEDGRAKDVWVRAKEEEAHSKICVLRFLCIFYIYIYFWK